MDTLEKPNWRPKFTLLGIFGGTLPLLLSEPNVGEAANENAANKWKVDRAGYRRQARLHSGLL